ncbi:MAG: response regulator [Myxococcota bacterium]|nr:response regulator [Deltaproteobacteria bacterium]MDQ3335660.1 response regulator [Myxococcota bacterium]
MRDEVAAAKWWADVRPPPDVARTLAEIALVRAQVFLPVVVIAMLVALVISEPSGIPLTREILVVNGLMFAAAVILMIQLRRGKIPAEWAHAVGALAWLFTPVNTLVSTALTSAPTLTLPLMIELASLTLLIDTRWALAASTPIIAVAVPLMIRNDALGIFPLAVLGLWIVAMIMQFALRRSLIRAETHRHQLGRALEALQHELSERQRAEADRETLRDQFVHAQRMEAVGTLSAGLAHDMNNILGGILAFAEILRHEAKDPTIREDLDRIRKEAERGAALTRGLLAFSRRGSYRRQPIAIGAVIDEMAPLLSRTLGKAIRLERADGPLAVVDADPAQLGQVLLNLCLNAADAMSGEGMITVSTDTVHLEAKQIGALARGTYAKLSVRDTGSGMDEATRKRMFEPFFTTKPVGKGTGLGLAMVYGAVEAHAGGIDVVSAAGKGTTVDIYLPTTEATPQPARRTDTSITRTKGVVLIVDDEATMRAGAARIIEHLGLTAVAASDGEEAVALFEQHGVEVVLVLLDMVMPRMNGTACFHALRKLRTVPILLVSGYTDHAAARELLTSGADGFLEKPYTTEQLAGEVDRVLGRAS